MGWHRLQGRSGHKTLRALYTSGRACEKERLQRRRSQTRECHGVLACAVWSAHNRPAMDEYAHGVFGIAVGRPGEARPVTLLIDEAPSLGYLPDLLPFMGQFRKAGLRVWIFTQTMAQLASDELYGQTGFKAIFGLCSIKQFFSIREPEVAQLASDLCGQKTVDNITENTPRRVRGKCGRSPDTA